MNKQFWIPVAAALMIAASVSAFADLSASDVVSQFNSMNPGAGGGFRFTYAGGTFTTASGTTQVNINAFDSSRSGVTSGNNYFQSFCAEPTVGTVASSGTATLSYNAATGRSTNTSGAVLSVASAYLFKQYATGMITSTGLQTLLHQLNTNTVTGDWTLNATLRSLLDINASRDYWLTAYNANQSYAFMEGYYTFIMDVRTNSNGNAQDFYYLAYGGGGGGGQVPEPATLLLWSLGGMGLAGASWRKRRMKKLAVS
ncbi:MAG: PEP-CTERM sorting domain-containing protein [Planctomycetaceae bacterium]|nr:PEP-CTERM sorting domain-containing protein [Planctomycetaceae bacterium]